VPALSPVSTRLSHCAAAQGVSRPVRVPRYGKRVGCAEASEVRLCVASLKGALAGLGPRSGAGDLSRAATGGTCDACKNDGSHSGVNRQPRRAQPLGWRGRCGSQGQGARNFFQLVRLSCSRCRTGPGSAGLWGTGGAQLMPAMKASRLCHRGIDGIVNAAGEGRRLTPHRAWSAGIDRMREPNRGRHGGADRCCAVIGSRMSARVLVSWGQSVVALQSYFPNEEFHERPSTEPAAA
jgi:hypothetical protein